MDDDDKVRRNLVVVSAAALAVNWLHLPMSNLIEKAAGGTTLVTIQSWRAWTLAAIVLLYLSQRYRLSVPYGDQKTALRAEWKQRCHVQARVLLKEEAAQFVRSGKQPRSIDIDMAAAAQKAKEKMNLLTGRDVGRLTSLELGDAEMRADMDPWSGQMNLHYAWEKRAATSDGNCIFKAARWFRMRARARVTIDVLANSRHSVEFLVPIALGAVALALCILNAALAYLGQDLTAHASPTS